jgi:ribosomal protein S12 methylthiotransferase
MPDQVDREVAMERLRYLSGIQEEITAERNAGWIGRVVEVVVDQVEDGTPVGRSHRQAPEIDGVIRLDRGTPGEWLSARLVGTHGPDMDAVVV